MIVNYKEKAACDYLATTRKQSEVQQFNQFKRLCVLFAITLILLAVYISTY